MAPTRCPIDLGTRATFADVVPGDPVGSSNPVGAVGLNGRAAVRSGRENRSFRTRTAILPEVLRAASRPSPCGQGRRERDGIVWPD